MQNRGGRQSIAEVRGVEAEQNLEGELTGITEAKMREVDPNGAESYTKKASDMRRLTEIEKLLKDNPHAELSDEDLIFLYELKSPIEGFGYERDPRIDQLLDLRREEELLFNEDVKVPEFIDSERLKPLLIEAIRQQTETSLKAAQEVQRLLGIEPITQEQYNQAFEAKWAEWQQNGTLEWVAERYERYGERYTLVATPNKLATSQQLMGLADEFAKGQGCDEAYKYPQLYELYSDEELSGVQESGQAVRFSLIPDQYTTELGGQPVGNKATNTEPATGQIQALAEMQTIRSNVYIPSVLDSVSYWYARRASGDSLNSGDVWGRTWIRHIDLEPHQLGGDLVVPGSRVFADGMPRLFRNDVRLDDLARVALG